MEGFTYHEDKLFPMIEVKLDGKVLSVQELVRSAEAMRQELLKYGVTVGVKSKRVGVEKIDD
jgi:hypothetical protein